MAFDVYEPEEKDEYIESIIDLPEGSLVMLREKEEADLRAIIEADMNIDEFLDCVKERFDRFCEVDK